MFGVYFDPFCMLDKTRFEKASSFNTTEALKKETNPVIFSLFIVNRKKREKNKGGANDEFRKFP